MGKRKVEERESGAVRLRVSFDEKKILQKSERKLGLKRSWVTLKPWHTTISDLVVHLLDVFRLENACPNGLILSMDGFVLPPFESTSILKDKDIVSVKRKGKSDALIKTDGEVNYSEKLGRVEKQPGLKLLASEEFPKETGGYESESGDNDPDKLKNTLNGGNRLPNIKGSKKRKFSEELKRSKKKNKHTITEEGLAPPVDKDGVHEEENGIINGDDNLSAKEKNLHNDIVLCNLHHELEKSSNSGTEEDCDPPCEPSPTSKRPSLPKENPKSIEDVSHTPDGTKKPHQRQLFTNNQLLSGKEASESPGKHKRHHELEKSSNSGTEEDSDSPCEPSPTLKRLSLPKENLKSFEDVSHMPDGTKKGPSRAARRKKAKRQWLREMAKISKIEPHQRQFTNNQLLSAKEASRSPGKRQQQVCKSSIAKKELHQSQLQKENSNRLLTRDIVGNEDDDIVPVVIRPGHIRFEPREKGQSTDQNQVSAENFQWNGITSKKKGLKWGTEKATSSKRVDYTNFNQGTPQSTNTKSHIDFRKLPHCSSVPKEDDVIAYRLIELSSTWTPELSSYRVGQVTKFHTATNRITLNPVPEFPIEFETKVDQEGSPVQPDTSLYGYDGSLEIGFSSLIDVRIVKSCHANAEALTGAVNKSSLGCQNTALERGKGNGWKDKWGSSSTWDGQVVCKEIAYAEANGLGERNQGSRTDRNVDAWEEISQTLNANKAQLSRKDNWSKKEDSGKRSWSHRGLRGSALGPTMARLRAQNQL